MRIFHNVTEADRRLWKAPLVSQLFPFLWAEPHHADVSLFCEDRSWQNDFSNSRSRITAWVARFLLKRSWRTVPVARYLTNVSVCFIQLSTNHESLSQPIMKIGYWLHYFFHFSFCLTIVLGRIKFDCTLEDLHPVCQRKWFAFEHSILSHLLWIARVAKSVLSRANLLPIL